MASDETRARWKEQNRCLQCGGEPDVRPVSGKPMRTCGKCRARMEQGHARWEERRARARGSTVARGRDPASIRRVGPVAARPGRTNALLVEVPEGLLPQVRAWHLLRRQAWRQYCGTQRPLGAAILVKMAEADQEADREA